MNTEDLLKMLEICSGSEIYVEFNEVVHTIHDVQDTSQGVILVVDTDEEEKEMR